MTDIVSAAILVTFVVLLIIAVVSTGGRWLRYRRTEFRRPRLLNRDVVLVVGLTIPFLLIAFVRVTDLAHMVSTDDGPHLWWLLLTGMPPIISMAVYDWYELRIIERDQEDAPPPPH